MKSYRSQILKIWRSNNKLNYSPLLIPQNIEINKTLVVGINPSNSFPSLSPVRKHFIKEWNKDRIVKNVKDQKSYNKFLRFENFQKHQNSTWKIQEWCHQKHKHFLKQKMFLERLKINEFTFIDLFPIWRCKQMELVKFLNKNRKLEKSLINQFIEMIDKEKIQKLIFLNKESFNKFRKHTKEFILPSTKKKINVYKANLKYVEKGILKLKSNSLQYYTIGIGGRDNNDILIKKLLKSKFLK